MTTRSGTVTVTSTAQSLLPYQTSSSRQEQEWSAYNAGAQTVWCGDKNVTVGNGIPIPPGGYATKRIFGDSVLYGIASSSTQLNLQMDGV